MCLVTPKENKFESERIRFQLHKEIFASNLPRGMKERYDDIHVLYRSRDSYKFT